ncbi:hypothetical protein I5481_01870 [Citrobacter freundii]|nr:hypothetical protein [Citrobacter freundii]
MRKNKCIFCGSPATLLCDGYLGFPPKYEMGVALPDVLHPFTCDAPMCEGCSTQMMKIFVCGKKPYAGIHTTDHCPVCLEVLPPYPKHTRRIIHSEQQAAQIRTAHWAEFTGRQSRHIKVLAGGGQQSFDF